MFVQFVSVHIHVPAEARGVGSTGTVDHHVGTGKGTLVPRMSCACSAAEPSSFCRVEVNQFS